MFRINRKISTIIDHSLKSNQSGLDSIA
jgi:hypothetical protein